MTSSGESPPHGLGAPPPEQFSDTRAVLRSALQDDQAAATNLWNRFLPGLRVRLLGKIRGLPMVLQAKLGQESEDLLNEVMTKGLAALPRFDYRGPGSVLAFLTQILQHEFVNRLEFWAADRRSPLRERPRPARDDSTRGVEPEMVAAGPGPLTIIGLSDQQTRVAEALAVLESRDREILYLRFFGGASWGEIVDQLGGASADAVRMECAGRSLPKFAVALKRSG